MFINKCYVEKAAVGLSAKRHAEKSEKWEKCSINPGVWGCQRAAEETTTAQLWNSCQPQQFNYSECRRVVLLQNDSGDHKQKTKNAWIQSQFNTNTNKLCVGRRLAQLYTLLPKLNTLSLSGPAGESKESFLSVGMRSTKCSHRGWWSVPSWDLREAFASN